MLKQQLRHFYITGLSNLVHPYFLSLIVDQNILTPIWHTFVLLWVLDTLLEHLTSPGLMDSLKFKAESSVHIFVCFHETLPRIGHTKFKCTLLAFAQNSLPLLALNVSPHELVFHIRPRLPLTFNLYLNRNKNNTCILQFCSQLPKHSHYDKTDLKLFFTKHSRNLFQNGSLQLKLLCHKFIQKYITKLLKKIKSQAYMTKNIMKVSLLHMLPLLRNVISLKFTSQT